MIDDFEKIILSKVKDVEPLVGVSMFPLALGWWIVIFLIFTMLVWFIYGKVLSYFYTKTWRYSVSRKLDKIVENLEVKNIKDSIKVITDILKRSAIKRYSREEVASLNGDKWIEWLEIRDLKNLNWKKHSDLLKNYPYMPEYKIQAKEKEIKELVSTIKEWL